MKTIYDVAKKANVSIATVSRVMNKKGIVTKKKEELVLKAIDELGYVPSFAARSIRAKSTGYIGLLLPTITVPFFLQIVRGIEEYIYKHDYSLVISGADYKFERIKSQLDVFKSKKIDGIIYDGLSTKEEEKILSDFLSKTNIPVVFLENFIDNVKSSYIINDNYAGSYEATNYLIGLGHKKIALLYSKPDLWQNKERLKGYIEALRNNGIEFDNSMLYVSEEVTINGAYKLVKKIINNKNKPTAIFCLADILAIGVLKYLYESNIKIPDAISVVGYDDMELSFICYPPLTTVHQKKRKMGYEAARILIDNINSIRNSKASIIERKVLKPYLVIRESSGPYKNL